MVAVTVVGYAALRAFGASRRCSGVWGSRDRCLPIHAGALGVRLGDGPHDHELQPQQPQGQRQEQELRQQCHRLMQDQHGADMVPGNHCEGSLRGSPQWVGPPAVRDCPCGHMAGSDLGWVAR